MFFLPFPSWVGTPPPSLSLYWVNLLNAELNPICHLLALLGAHHILHISRIRVNVRNTCCGAPAHFVLLSKREQGLK